MFDLLAKMSYLRGPLTFVSQSLFKLCSIAISVDKIFSRMCSNKKIKTLTQVKADTLGPVSCCFVFYVITFPENLGLKSHYVRKLYLSSRQFDAFSDVSMLIFNRRGNLQA